MSNEQEIQDIISQFEQRHIQDLVNEYEIVNKILDYPISEEQYYFYNGRKKLIEDEFNQINVSARNKESVKKLADRVLKQQSLQSQITNFIRNGCVNCCITAGTQVGKTSSICTFVKRALDDNFSVIISSANKNDQLDQIYSRISQELSDRIDTIFIKYSSKTITKAFDRVREQHSKFVVFCLDNASQINRVKEACYFSMCIMGNNKLVLIHDEADTIVKAKNVNEIEPAQAVSHSAWIEFADAFMKNPLFTFKRVFVTATPLLIADKFPIKIENIIVLETPNGYNGWNNIEMKAIYKNDTKSIIQRFVKDVERPGALLYCTDKVISEQNVLFKKICNYIDCPVSIYNGNGITVRIEKDTSNKFLEMIKRRKTEYELSIKVNESNILNDDKYNVYKITELPISILYQVLKDLHYSKVITIGYDLMQRGISFVSIEKKSGEQPLAAVDLIYQCGNSLNTVSINQAIGRITGTVNPHIKRKLYSTQEIIDSYINYNMNQDDFFAKLKESDVEDTSEFFNSHYFIKKIKRGS